MSSKNPYRVAILGCSPDRGRQHVRAFKLNSDRFEVVALCDHNTEQLTNVASEFAVQNTYSEVDDMLSKHNVDVFCFVTQPRVRLPLIKTAIDYGIKVIAFEKPMAGSLAEALEIYNLCKANDVKFIVSHQQKYGNHYQTARRLIQEGDIGKVHSIHASSKGWLLYWGSHLADLMMYLNDGARAKWVVGQAIGTDQLKDAKGHASPDFVMGHFQFENEVNGIMECGPLAPSFPIKEDNFWLNAGVKVYGSDGYLMMINNSGHFGGVRGVTKTSRGFFTTPGGFNSDLDQPIYIRELADWLDNPAQVHSCSNEMAFHGFEMMMGMWLSGLDGKKLEFPMNRTDNLVERMGKTR